AVLLAHEVDDGFEQGGLLPGFQELCFQCLDPLLGCERLGRLLHDGPPAVDRSLPILQAVFATPYQNGGTSLYPVASLCLLISQLTRFDLRYDGELKSQTVIPLGAFSACFHLTLLCFGKKVSTYFRTGQSKQKGRVTGLFVLVAALCAGGMEKVLSTSARPGVRGFRPASCSRCTRSRSGELRAA